MKKLSVIALVLMIGYIAGSISLNDVSAAAAKPKKNPKLIKVCLPGIECFEYETAVAPGFANQVIQVLQEVFDKAQHGIVEMVEEITYAAVEKYMAEHPCECASSSSSSSSSRSTDGPANFTATLPPTGPYNEITVLAAPVGVITDHRVDMWLETNVNDDKYFIPLFR